MSKKNDNVDETTAVEVPETPTVAVTNRTNRLQVVVGTNGEGVHLAPRSTVTVNRALIGPPFARLRIAGVLSYAD